MTHYRKDVSDAEVKHVMDTVFDEMSRDVVPRVVPKTIVVPKPGAKPNPADERGISAEELELLMGVMTEPNLSVTKRASRLGLSAYKMNELKASCIKNGLFEQFTVNLGKEFGGRITLLSLTAAGYKALGKKPVLRPENMGHEHWWWQNAIADYFARKGYVVEIERAKGAVRADVCLSRNGEEIAIEVELSPKNAVPNIVSDLEAGFSKVVSCCKDERTANEVRRRLESFEGFERIKDRVEVKVLYELQLVKEMA